jgi:hypothetical protein
LQNKLREVIFSKIIFCNSPFEVLEYISNRYKVILYRAVGIIKPWHFASLHIDDDLDSYGVIIKWTIVKELS